MIMQTLNKCHYYSNYSDGCMLTITLSQYILLDLRVCPDSYVQIFDSIKFRYFLFIIIVLYFFNKTKQINW